MRDIKIFNAHINNLKNVNLNIPKGKLVVVTGVSGSGKSSLVFDILATEGRNMYLQALGDSYYIEKKGFDKITGLNAVIAVDQRIIRFSNPRSTVGTWTDLYHLLQVLYSKEGVRNCSCCNKLVKLGSECPACKTWQNSINIKILSYNSILGLCQDCCGRGYVYETDLDKLIPDKRATLAAICKRYLNSIAKDLHIFTRYYNLSPEIKFYQMKNNEVDSFLNGFCSDDGERFIGVIESIQKYKEIMHFNPQYEYHMKKIGKKVACPSCKGYRISKDHLDITIGGLHIGKMGHMSIAELNEFLLSYLNKNNVSDDGIKIINSILRYNEHFINVGLSYLSAFRTMPTLSGGEAQRISLMKHINSKMDSIIYVFDEPTAGMHEIEKEMLIRRLKDLRDRGNSILVVEHDKQMIKNADYIIEFGPYAGVNGGEVIFQGKYDEILKSTKSVFGMSNSQLMQLENDIIVDNNSFKRKLTLENVWTNNLKGITVDIPLGMLVGISGVSGSGKSSLISDTLVPMLKIYFDCESDDDELYDVVNIDQKTRLLGTSLLTGFVDVSQEPIGRHMTSIPLTYIKVWDKIRKLYADLPDSKQLGFTPSDFSFNSKGGCSVCNGRGVETIFLGEKKISYECPECEGKRYREEVLKVKYKEKSIYDILSMNVSEGAAFFKDKDSIYFILSILDEMGMGYIRLGQSTPTLSGGEAQRIKLAKELGRKKKGNTLYILDEPTTGLSVYDTKNLMKIINKLIQEGNSVIICEHDIDVLSNCNWIIELGPKGGYEGGQVIAQGTPADLRLNQQSNISPYLIAEKG